MATVDSGKNRVAGVYQIRNTITNKKYIEASEDVCAAMFDDLRMLQNRRHPCIGLRVDSTEHGLCSFEFSILEIVKVAKGEEQTLEEKMFAARDKWWSKYSIDYVYNKPAPRAVGGQRPEDFVFWVIREWAIGQRDDLKANRDKKIWNDEQRNAIVQKATECGFCDITPNLDVTFRRVIRDLINFHGFQVEECVYYQGRDQKRAIMIRRPEGINLDQRGIRGRSPVNPKKPKMIRSDRRG